eukprot:CFRG6013T1
MLNEKITKKPTIRDVPIELISAVLQSLCVRDLRECRLVCRLWKSAANDVVTTCHTPADQDRVSEALLAYPLLEALHVDGITIYSSTDVLQNIFLSPPFTLDSNKRSEISYPCTLQTLRLTFLHAEVDILRPICEFQNLQCLHIRAVKGLADESMKYLLCCGSLTTIELDSINITDKGIAMLGCERSTLKESVYRMSLSLLPGVTDVGISDVLNKFRVIEELNLEQLPNVSDATMCHVARNSTLRRLSLSNMRIGDNGLSRLLEPGTSLQELVLQSIHTLTPVGIMTASRILSLRDLTLKYLPKIKFYNIQPIFNIPSLKVHVFGMRTW